MSTYQQKPNSFSLFKNERKETDTHPDYKGSGLIDGLGEVWVDAWINESKDGKKYMSGKVKPKNADQQGSYGRQEPARGGGVPRSFEDDLSDDVPFISGDPSLEYRVR